MIIYIYIYIYTPSTKFESLQNLAFTQLETMTVCSVLAHKGWRPSGKPWVWSRIGATSGWDLGGCWLWQTSPVGTLACMQAGCISIMSSFPYAPMSASTCFSTAKWFLMMFYPLQLGCQLGCKVPQVAPTFGELFGVPQARLPVETCAR